MRTNVVIFDGDGNALYGASVSTAQPANTAAHLAHISCWVTDTLAMLQARGITQLAVVQYEPEYGGDYASTRAIECHSLKLQLHTTPERGIEVVGMYHQDAAAPTASGRAAARFSAVRSGTPQGRGHRVLHSTVPGLECNATLCSRGEPLAAAAARHRTQNPRAWGTP